jgi:hypothetical protein
MSAALGDEYLSDHVEFQILTHCTVVQPVCVDCDFFEICAVLSDVFDVDRTSIDPLTGVMKGFIDQYLVLVLPYSERRLLCSVVTTPGDCS